MPGVAATIATRLTRVRERLTIDLGIGVSQALLIDRGRGLLYDVERNITWLQDANYARTVGRSSDGQLTWQDAKSWVAALSYQGIRGWRLPDARSPAGVGPSEGENNADGEIGHLFIVAAKRMAPPTLALTHFEPNSIYWYRNEASATEAFAFRMLGLRQGRLNKDPWHGSEINVPLVDKVLVWPVHDGDVGQTLFSRLVARLRAAVSLTGRA